MFLFIIQKVLEATIYLLYLKMSLNLRQVPTHNFFFHFRENINKKKYRGTSVLGHLRDWGKCPLNRGVPWMEVWLGFVIN